MKIWTSKGEVNLSKSHYLASGGEGNIYARDGLAYKLYADPSKMIPTGKIQELSSISDPNVIRPQDVVYDKQKKPIGYSMRFVKNTYAMCQLFTKAFRTRQNIDHKTMFELVKKLQNMVSNVHKAAILVVDLNEMNFLVDNGFKEVFAIDVDSYQTKHYPATALMESVRDRHSKGFSELTDWFAFGIVSFQMMIGIHPYKGKHPTVKTMDERMQKNISVFNRDVGVPKVCYPFSVIPKPYEAWYRALFEEGKRLPPPDSSTQAILVVPVLQQLHGTNQFDIEELYEIDGSVIDILFAAGNRAILSDKKFSLSGRELTVSPGLKLGLEPSMNNVILGKIDAGMLKFFNPVEKKEIPCTVSASALMAYNGRFYAKHDDAVLEIDFTTAGKNVLISSKPVANVLENASKMYDGVVVQNLLGTYYVSMFPEPGVHRQLRIKELEKYQVIDAKFDKNVLMVIGTRKKDNHLYYDRFVFRFDKDWATYDIRKVENVNYAGLNFTTLDSGICVMLNEDEEIEIFSNRKDSSKVRTIQDPVLGNDMRLFNNGASLVFSRGGKVYSMKMK